MSYEYMRRSGKTTRLVDEAVQYLFRRGVIEFIPPGEVLDLNYVIGRLEIDKQMLLKFVDTDAYETPNAQDFFINQFCKRLSIEHYGSYIRIGAFSFKVK
jgi:hypothetical protein